MTVKTVLKLLFSTIFLALLGGTLLAWCKQPLLQWGGLTREPDRYWTIATLLDAYGGFLTFYAWVYYKETRRSARVLWFIAIMALGNLAMSAYLLLKLWRLRADQPAADVLVRGT